MTNREKLTRLIIEAIHGLPYEKAISKFYTVNYKCPDNISGCMVLHQEIRLPFITIGRVMQAFDKKGSPTEIITNENGTFIHTCGVVIIWKLNKENCQEATLEDQSEETINALLQLFE